MKKLKIFFALAAAAAFMTIASCENEAPAEDKPSFASADPAATARESAKLAAFCDEFAEGAESGETVTIDLGAYGAALLRLRPAAILLSASAAPVTGAPFCLAFPGKTNITVRIINSSAERRTLSLTRTGSGGVSYTDTDAGALIFVGRGVTLEIDGDITLDGITRSRDVISNTLPLIFLAGGKLVLDGGARVANNDVTIVTSSTNFQGGGISANYGAEVTMREAEIDNCSSGGPSHVNRSVAGGGIGLINSSLVMEKTAKIINCSTGSTTGGGGLYATGSKVLMKDDTLVAKNFIMSTGSGAGVYLAGGCTFEMSGNAEISENTKNSAGGGGGVYIRATSIPTSFTMRDNSTIRKNRVVKRPAAGSPTTGYTGYGGGVYLQEYGIRFEMLDDASITDNVVTGAQYARGGGLYAEYSVSDTRAAEIILGGRSRIERNAAYIIKRQLTNTGTEGEEVPEFGYAAGSGVYIAANSNTAVCELRLEGSAEIPRTAAPAAAQNVFSDAAKAAFEYANIPEEWVLYGKSDMTNAVALESTYTASSIPARVYANNAVPPVVDIASTYVNVSQAALSAGTATGVQGNHTATAYLIDAGLVLSLTAFPSIPDLRMVTSAAPVYFLFPSVTSLTGTHGTSAFTVNEIAYTVALTINTANWSVNITGGATANVSSTTAPNITTTNWKLVSSAKDIMKLSVAQRTILSGAMRKPVQLGRLIPVGMQNGSNGMPSGGTFPLDDYTVNASGVIVAR